MQLKMWFAIGVCGFAVMATGCICAPGGACGTPLVTHQTASCDSCCDSGCGSGTCGDFYGGRGPLASFFGLASCSGGGCGELYIDERINEPPTLDQCGYGECLNCGRTPIRSLFRAIFGEQYHGSCGTCDSDHSGHGPIIHDGYDATSFLNARNSCCGGAQSSHPMVLSNTPGSVHSPAGMETVHPTADPSAIPGQAIQGQSIINGGSASPTGVNGTPTPAPALTPTSAYRLNPAMRRVVR